MLTQFTKDRSLLFAPKQESEGKTSGGNIGRLRQEEAKDQSKGRAKSEEDTDEKGKTQK